MDTEFILDTLSDEDYQATQEVSNRLAECRTREEFSLLISTSLYLLIGFNGVFYRRFEGEDKTPQLLSYTGSATICQCRWQDFYEITLQNHLLKQSRSVDQSSLLVTDTFCCIGRSCLNCLTESKNCFNHKDRNCTFIVLFDSIQPTVALYFFRVTPDTQLYNKREILLLQMLRAALLQTFNAITYKEELDVFQQILNHLSNQDELLAIVNMYGHLIYKNNAFNQAVGEENCSQLLSKVIPKSKKRADYRENNCYLLTLGQRLYTVDLTTMNIPNQKNMELTLLHLSRVTDKKLNINRKLHSAGLSSRELEIAILIIQGISTHNLSNQLHLSYHTIRNHIKHIYGKLGVSTRSEMLTWGGG